MRFNRLQTMITLLWLLPAVGAVLQSLYLHDYLLVTTGLLLSSIVALALTFVPHAFWLRMQIVIGRWLDRTSPKVSLFFRNTLGWLRVSYFKSKGYLWPKIQQLWDTICRKADQQLQKVKVSTDQNPNLWLGGVHVAITIVLFLCAYVYKSWNLFHFGLVLLATSPLFFIHHHDKWDEVGDFISDNVNGIWLGVSIAAGTLSYGHAWGLLPIVVSAISAVFAIITIAGWWGAVGDGIGKAVGAMSAKVNEQLRGDYGLAIFFMFCAFVVFLAYNFLFMGKIHLEGRGLDLATTFGLAFVIPFAISVYLFIRTKHQKM